MSLSLIDYYIAHRFAPLGLDLESEEIDWSFSESLRDYVNTRLLFRGPRLMSVLARLLETLAEKPDHQEKCRKSDRYLRLWITGFETLYQQTQNTAFLPFTHPISSGRYDLLMRPELQMLLSLDEETYLKVTDQHRLPPAEQLSLDAFAATEPYWIRFMDYLALYVDQVADGVFTPVMLEARVVFNNGVILKTFTADMEVDNVQAIVSRDYGEVVRDAIAWVRAQFAMPAAPNVVALRPARSVDTQAA